MVRLGIKPFFLLIRMLKIRMIGPGVFGKKARAFFNPLFIRNGKSFGFILNVFPGNSK
jgi:hypothetical protein